MYFDLIVYLINVLNNKLIIIFEGELGNYYQLTYVLDQTF